MKLSKLIFILFAGITSWAADALPSTMVWEVEAGGSAGNGGGFDSASSGTDRSRQALPQIAINNAAITCTTTGANSNTLTFTGGYTPSAADVGNVVQFISGTNINPGFGKITAQTSSTWTILMESGNLTTATGAGSAIVANMGGAFASPQTALSRMQVGGMTTWLAYSTTPYSISTGLTTPSGPSYGTKTRLVGYNTVRGDIAIGGLARPIVKTTAAVVAMTLTASGYSVENIEFDGNSTGTQGMVVSAGYDNQFYNCRAHGFTAEGAQEGGTGGCGFISCEIDHCAGSSYAVKIANGGILYSSVHDNTKSGVGGSGSGVRVIGNLIFNNTGASTDGVTVDGLAWTIQHNDIYNNGRHGIYLGTYDIKIDVSNNIMTGNGQSSGTGYGLKTNATTARFDVGFHHNAYFNNKTGATSGNTVAGLGDVTLTADPYTSAGTDFTLNNAAGAGAVLRGTGGFATPGGLGVNYIDIGALQHQDSGGGVISGGTRAYSIQ